MVLFPLTNSLDNEIYVLNFFPIPLDNDIKNKDANEFTSKPRYLIYNGKNLLFTFLDESFLRDCLTAGSTILKAGFGSWLNCARKVLLHTILLRFLFE